MEIVIARVLFASRWLLVPLYVALAVMLALLAAHEAIELVRLVPTLLAIEDKALLLEALGLVDVTLVAGLIVMVMISGYENFVSRATMVEEASALAWLGKLDAGSLKIKLAVTILAISMIHLLEELLDADHVTNDKLFWLVAIQLTFVVTAVALAAMDRLTAADDR